MFALVLLIDLSLVFECGLALELPLSEVFSGGLASLLTLFTLCLRILQVYGVPFGLALYDLIYSGLLFIIYKLLFLPEHLSVVL